VKFKERAAGWDIGVTPGWRPSKEELNEYLKQTKKVIAGIKFNRAECRSRLKRMKRRS
jgi:hypothetical protein